MSTYENHVFYCLQCGSKMNHNLLVGMHITRLPKVREAILQEKFQHVECRNCQFVNRVEKPSIYTDFERNHYVAVELPVVCDWRKKVNLHREAFDQSFFWGAPVAQEMGRSMITRVVFGLRALREKLLIWDAGLDDRIIEIGKRKILTASGLDTKQVSLRLLSIRQPSKELFFGLFERPKLNVSDSVVQSQIKIFEPIDTLTVFQKTHTDWHLQAPKLLQQNPWARQAWFVDSLVAEM